MEETLTEKVTRLIHYLATSFPDKEVNDLMLHAWALFNTRTCDVCSFAVATPTAALVKARDSGKFRMMMLIPEQWDDTPVKELGAMVFCGSQVVDYYNDRLNGSTPLQIVETKARARMYEAQFLRTVFEQDASIVPDDYQREIMEEHPNLRSGLVYPRKRLPLGAALPKSLPMS